MFAVGASGLGRAMCTEERVNGGGVTNLNNCCLTRLLISRLTIWLLVACSWHWWHILILTILIHYGLTLWNSNGCFNNHSGATHVNTIRTSVHIDPLRLRLTLNIHLNLALSTWRRVHVGLSGLSVWVLLLHSWLGLLVLLI